MLCNIANALVLSVGVPSSHVLPLESVALLDRSITMDVDDASTSEGDVCSVRVLFKKSGVRSELMLVPDEDGAVRIQSVTTTVTVLKTVDSSVRVMDLACAGTVRLLDDAVGMRDGRACCYLSLITQFPGFALIQWPTHAMCAS